MEKVVNKFILGDEPSDYEYWEKKNPVDRLKALEQLKSGGNSELIIQKDFMEFIKIMNKNKVQFLIVGGFAVAFHGNPRFTGDIDFFYKNTPGNISNIINSLNEFGFKDLGVAKEDLAKDYAIIQLGYPPNRIDLINNAEGLNFQDAWDNKETLNVNNEEVFFISFNDLIKNKKSTGRPKDLWDIEKLKK